VGARAESSAARSSVLMASDGIWLADSGISKPQRQRLTVAATLAPQFWQSCFGGPVGAATCAALVAWVARNAGVGSRVMVGAGAAIGVVIAVRETASAGVAGRTTGTAAAFDDGAAAVAGRTVATGFGTIDGALDSLGGFVTGLTAVVGAVGFCCGTAAADVVGICRWVGAAVTAGVTLGGVGFGRGGTTTSRSVGGIERGAAVALLFA
jgi:hypothetical protein